jgi:hypothetical protein
VTETLLLLGGLPMANILAVGLLPLVLKGSGGGRRNPSLVGFEAVGWSVLLLYAACAVHHPDTIRGGVVCALGPLRPLGGSPVLTAAVGLLLPQVALALFGGWLSARCAGGISTGPGQPA